MQLTDVVTPITALELAAALNTAWRKLFDAPPSRDTVLVLLAQSAHESERWKSVHCFNLGNVRSFDGDGRDFTFFRCRETKRNGDTIWRDPPHPRTRHRAYPTLAAGALDYLAFLQSDKRFADAWEPLTQGKPRAFVSALHVTGYHQGDEGAHARAVGKLFGEFNGQLPIPLPELVADDAELGAEGIGSRFATSDRGRERGTADVVKSEPPPPIVLEEEDEPADLEPNVHAHDTEPSPPPADDDD